MALVGKEIDSYEFRRLMKKGAGQEMAQYGKVRLSPRFRLRPV